jgi:diguanylate cyclase (GGDEF)-like protein/PAS domain S-box-containing protein
VAIDVAYTALPAGAHGTPFLDEEAALLQSLADMLGARLERDRLHTALREQEETFRDVFENAGVGMTLVDAQQRIVRCNPAFARMLGYGEQELSGVSIARFSHADDMQTNAQLYESLVAGDIDRFQMLKRYLRKDGSQVWGELTVSRARAGREAGYLTIGMVEDVTERMLAESRLEHLATHDALTDLPNRYLINDRINQALPLARRAGTLVGVMCVGLDRFKITNDAFGHRYGDELLRCVAGRLCEAIREGDTVARHNGDEFLILLADLRRSTDAYIVAQKVLEAVAAPIRLQDRETYITASVGVSVAPQDGSDADTLAANADAAMHRAKDLGRNTYQFFTRAMSEETRDRVDLETRLRHAIAREELQLMYQPKVDLASGAIIGCEALLRWNQPGVGAISPAQFIPIAEDSGLIVPIGDWVLRTACAQNLACQRAGLAPITVSVNISARQVLQQDVARWVLGVLDEPALAGCWLELELTESLIAQDVEAVIDTIHALKEVGIKMSIDDFGTGYSSLSYLKRFRVDILKVDKSFVRDLLSDPDDAAIARAVISLGHSLGMKVIAEGVESAAQCAFLRTHGCDEIQGYYFSVPVPAARIAEMLASGLRLDMQAWGETSASVQSA